MINYNEDFILNEARKFIGSKFGIVKSISQNRRMLGEGTYFQFSCNITDISKTVKNCINPKHSTSASLNKKDSEIGAICEALERYCGIMKNYEDEQIYVSSKNSNGYHLFPLDKFPTCSKVEYDNPYNPLSKPQILQNYYWTKCYDLIKDTDIYVPSSFVFLNFKINSNHELINTPNSTATAGGQSIEEAAVSAILEGLERDAIMVTWLNQLPRCQIDIESIEAPEVLMRINVLKKLDVDIFLYDISTDFNIPIIMCILRSENYPYYTVTAAAKLNIIDAISRALDEGFSTRRHAQFNKEDYTIKNYNNNYNNVVNFDDHLYLYNKHIMHNKLNFLVKSEKKIDANKIKTNTELVNKNKQDILQYFINEFSDRELSLIIKDITTSDISNSIFKFVKVFSPELVWLTPNHNYRFLRTKRIKECLSGMNYESYLDKDITNLPHPFA